MGSLFWKIFVGFWLAMAIIAVGSAVLTAQLAEQRLSKLATLPDDDTLDRWSRELRQALSSGNPTDPRRWIRAHGHRNHGIWVLDERGNDIRHRRVPTALLDEPTHGWSIRDWIFPTLPRRQRWLRTEQGTQYRLVVTPGPPRPMGRPMGRARKGLFGRWFWTRHLIVIGVGGLFCWLLARYLTQPLRHLRVATQKLAAGDMDARVSTRLGNRRDEIADLARDFDAMAENLARLLESRRQLLWDLSHELRSPLARLQVALELARTRPATQSHAAMDRIQTESQCLNELIGESLQWARLDSKPVVVSKSLNLAELLQNIADDAAYEGQRQQITMTVQSPNPCNIHADPVLLGRAINNVFRNAIHHAPSGSQVSVEASCSAHRIQIRVRDRGPGVKDTDLERMFEPFVRLDPSRSHASQGSGLGLAIARAAVEANGGKISARNHLDGGLEIAIDLPA